MSVLEELGAFWIIGIAFNVTLAAVLIWWVLRQIKPHRPAPGKESSSRDDR
ncbi:hypothetical protein [Thioalkalivibrio denitrificans]|uniref:hypothetical protein n=1 Tax=Thioalkalivibrio denitrificans TaxID=108003 RepID=UPI00158F6278|nr:hypothetical protein [Thioalkalivibrio denitrificans]